MGDYVIKMPDLGEGIAEVEVVAWRVQPGDAVKEDQVLADVMTDKATVEIPSPVHGTVLGLGGKVGQALAVGAELIRLQVEGAGNAAAAPVARTAEAGDEPAELPHGFVPEPPRVAEAAASVARREPAPATPAPSAAPVSAPAPSRPQARAAGEKPQAAPAVRKRAWDLGIELQYVAGSGPAGRITHADLDAHLAGRGRHAGGGDSRYAQLDGEETIPVIGLRRKIAEKMQLAKRQIPHFTYVEEVDVTELEALRKQLNERYGEERGRITLLPLLMRAVVLAVRRYPEVNARYDDGSGDGAGIVTRYQAVHIGVATQTGAGLMVPVVRNSEARDPWSNAAEIARLAQAARDGKCARDELSGSTITITSLGALGGIVSTPVINHPEVAIVGINRIVERPVVRDGGMVARKLMNLSSSFDHRVIDGMVAAEFIQTIRGYLEAPTLLFVE
ncbi:dihydrolipoamide acetyltransferase family protein [Massilia sp. YIM B02763]|uniref:dihydrolipoamide acetyltransferase family protein n=1 Tax=Massilia sp. YIM B02763 TaxID=3050130 RepID=UPI0025B718AB|nr:dihydrolipoamide acetyltransferase family protein [Massilia sp. YIM B02763]MDN4054014.1 dihydrolipoamide acetyltransferase family protein [Massilia sp. YIM B02763]